MRIALIGATGNVGSRVLAELVRRGHSVTVISRNPDRGPSLVDVISKRGNVIDQHGVAQQLKRHDAVICSFHRERTTQAAGSCARLWCETLPRGRWRRIWFLNETSAAKR